MTKHYTPAEVEALLNESYETGCWSEFEEVAPTIARQFVEQAKEIAELRKDKARLDWLQSNTRVSSLHMGGQHRYSMRFAVQEGMRGPSFRAAIDEAMK